MNRKHRLSFIQHLDRGEGSGHCVVRVHNPLSSVAAQNVIPPRKQSKPYTLCGENTLTQLIRAMFLQGGNSMLCSENKDIHKPFLSGPQKPSEALASNRPGSFRRKDDSSLSGRTKGCVQAKVNERPLLPLPRDYMFSGPQGGQLTV
jgi:hypothetical protein